jgi:3-oxoacyl-[acyl-carrier protein] reductase
MSDQTRPTVATTRVALITGGSGGIGQQTAKRLVADGFAVVINYAGRPAEAEKTVEEITKSGGQAIAVRADVADEQAVTAMFDTVEQAFGGIDVIVNAAGIMPLSSIADLDLDVFDRLVRVNLRGAFVVAKHGTARLRDGGAFLFLSSSQVGLLFPGYAPYAATKSGVEAMVRVLTKELRGRSITANVVAPGPTGTPLFYQGKDEAAIKQFANLSPLERLGTPEDVAELLAFLASPAGHWVNGQVIRPNGGII